jgi:hypothetical protein
VEEVTDTKIYAYSTEVTVEIMGVDGHGDFAIVSRQFDTGDDETTLRAREELDPNTDHTLKLLSKRPARRSDDPDQASNSVAGRRPMAVPR